MRLGLFALVRQKGYEPLAAAIQDGVGPRLGLVAGRLRAAAASTIRARFPLLRQLARHARPLHARLRRARPRRAEGRRVGAAAAVDARAVEGRRRGRRVVGDPTRSAQIGAPERCGADRRRARRRTRPIRTSRSTRSPRSRALKSQAGAALHPGPPHRRLADDARGGGARHRGDRSRRAFSTLLSGMEPDPHWIVRAAIADVLAVDAAAGRGRAAARACSTTRTSASSRRRSTAWRELKAPGLDDDAARAAEGRRHRRPRRRGARRSAQVKPAGGAGGAARRVPRGAGGRRQSTCARRC